MERKQAYAAPQIVQLGSVADLTQAGFTTPIVNDFKDGSNNASGPPNGNGIGIRVAV